MHAKQNAQFQDRLVMTYRVCICCGERMSPKDNRPSWNPNVCVYCSSLVDLMDETNLPGGLIVPVPAKDTEARRDDRSGSDNGSGR